MVKTMVNPHRYSPPVPYNSVFKLTFASSGQHEDLFSLFDYYFLVVLDVESLRWSTYLLTLEVVDAAIGID